MTANPKTGITVDRQFISQISHFAYLDNGVWSPFPKWATYYLELGAALSSYTNPGYRFVAAITVPVRSFASALVAFGVIASKAELPSRNLEPHISKIKSLPIGTPIIYRTNNTKYEGTYEGTVSSFGKEYFLVKYQKGTEKAIEYSDSYKIEFSEKQHISLPNVQSGRHLSPPSPLLRDLFGSNLLNRFLAESRLECVILAQQKSLQQELCNFQIGYPNDTDTPSQGRIVDVVRVKGPQFQASSLTYRSYVLAPSGKYSQQFTSRLNHYVTIFDSTLGFMRWGSYFEKSNWLVVLDKTDRNFDLAVKEINAEYFRDRADQQTRLPLPNPPAGIDVMFFETSL